MKKPSPRRILKLLVFALIGCYLAALTELYVNQSKHVYFPEKEWTATPRQTDPAYEDVRFTARDGVRLSGWYVPSRADRGTVLILHGNARNMSSDMDVIEMFPAMGWNVFIIDYRGYGQSEGTPTEEGAYLDARAAWDWLLTKKNERPERIVLLGRSLGAAIAAHLAAEVPAGGLILEAAFTRLVDVGQERYPLFPVKFLSKFRYETINDLPKSRCPVLLIHSRDDEVVRFHHAESLLKAAGSRAGLVAIGGPHRGGYLPTRGIYLRGMRDFLERLQKVH